jgi:outer membrane protein assembly factor BamB
MCHSKFTHKLIGGVFVVLLPLFTVQQAQAQDWLQWGGPNRNFIVNSKGLANAWPDSGPKRLWKRDLGEGHSAIIADREKLFTMYRQGEKEAVIALEAKTGKTIWEYVYDAPTAGMNYREGYGPHATPLVVGDRIFTVGALAKLHALDKKTGKVIWSRDLWKEHNGKQMDRGYSCSPVAYKDMIILTVGGPGQALMAFNQKDGSVAWKKQDLDVSPSSHLIINVGGQDQLVAFMGKFIAGLDPSNGELLWSHSHETSWGLNITTPVWNSNDNLLFVSSAYNGGSRVLKLTRGADGKTSVSEVWAHKRMRVHHATAIRIGDYVYGSSGDFGPAFVVAVNVKTGDVAWQDRSFSKSNLVYADGKVIVLDEDGTLAIVTVSPEGMKILSQVELMDKLSWTAPTLVGTKLYVRDRKVLVALDLS